MEGVVEELTAGPRQLSHRTRLLLASGVSLLMAVFLLAGSQHSACSPPGWTPGPTSPARPWLGADDPFVRDLHFAALDRARTARDVAPADVMPADVHRTTRALGDEGGIAVYLADGPDFACLGVDGRRAHHEVAKQCLLDTTIANLGLYAAISTASTSKPGYAAGDGDAVWVVAVPDHARLLTSASTRRLADYSNVVVLVAGRDDVLLQLPGRPPFALDRPTAATTFTTSC